MMKPFFSIIIPLYNKENFIVNTLNSVFSQTFNSYEIIIVNDGSTDTSVDKITRINDDRIKIIHQENQGVSVARNKGIEMANAEYVCFLDADDYWYPNFLQTFYELIVKYNKESVFSAAFQVETQWKTFNAKYSILKEDNDLIVDFFDASQQECVLWTSCCIFHKSVFQKVGMFDSTIKIAQDTDLWIRIGLIYPIVFTWNVLAIHKYDSKSLAKKTDNLNDRLNFSKFIEQEKTNNKLNQYLDLNRYALAMHCKLNNDNFNLENLRKQIKLKNLPLRKKILLYTPKSVIHLLIKVQNTLIKNGLRNSVFK